MPTKHVAQEEKENLEMKLNNFTEKIQTSLRTRDLSVGKNELLPPPQPSFQMSGASWTLISSFRLAVVAQR